MTFCTKKLSNYYYHLLYVSYIIGGTLLWQFIICKVAMKRLRRILQKLIVLLVILLSCGLFLRQAIICIDRFISKETQINLDILRFDTPIVFFVFNSWFLLHTVPAQLIFRILRYVQITNMLTKKIFLNYTTHLLQKLEIVCIPKYKIWLLTNFMILSLLIWKKF